MISSKGARTITVRDRQFRWVVRRKPTYAQSLAMSALNVAVVAARGGACTLVIALNDLHPGNLLARPSGSVTPALVAECISRALDEGWTPDQAGPPFVLSL